MQRQSSGGRARAIVFLIASLLLAGFAAMLVVGVWKRSEQRVLEASKPKATVDVVVAIKDLYMGWPITPDDVAVRTLAPEMVSGDHTFSKLEDVLGRTPRERILSNEPLRKERLAEPNAGIGLNAIVTPGKRAMTISTSTETAVAGLLQAGNFIDVIVTIKPDDPAAVGAKWVTETILEQIKVLAVGSTLDRGDGTTTGTDASGKPVKKASDSSKRSMKPSITLEVLPEEAEKLALASSRGEITVVLRSDIDIYQIDSHGPVTTDKLIGFERDVVLPDPIPRRTAPVEKPPELPKAEVISGASKTEVTWQQDGTSTEKTQRGGKNR